MHDGCRVDRTRRRQPRWRPRARVRLLESPARRPASARDVVPPLLRESVVVITVGAPAVADRQDLADAGVLHPLDLDGEHPAGGGSWGDVNKLVPSPISGLERGCHRVRGLRSLLAGRRSRSRAPALCRALNSTLVFVGLLPNDGSNHLIKRVIGLPGDHVVCCNKNKQLTVNGVALTEPYLFPGDTPSQESFNITVPPGRVWVMGDHRS